MLNRRTLLQSVASAFAILPFERLRLLAQPRELAPEAIATLHEIAPTVLPGSIGAARVAATVDRFVAWTRGYREGVAMTHGAALNTIAGQIVSCTFPLTQAPPAPNQVSVTAGSSPRAGNS